MHTGWKKWRAVLALVGLTLAVVLIGGRSGVEVAAAATSETLWGSGAPSGARDADDNGSVELGTAFTTLGAGTVTGVRYWRNTVQTGSQSTSLWTDDGQLLASAAAPSTGATGWQTAWFSSPVTVAKGDSFVASYHAPRGQYAYTASYHGASTSTSLSIPTSDAGRYVYGSSTSFPTRSYNSTNYWVTPVYASAASGSTPTVPTSTPTPTPTTTPTATAPAPAPTASSTPTVTKPGPSNTGVPDGTTLSTYNGPRTITTAGTVIDSKDITGGLVIRAKNVVIKNSKIHDGPDAVAGVYVDGGSATISDSEIYDFDLGITYDNWTAIRVDLHDLASDGVKMSSNTRLQDSWVHDPSPILGAHWDGVQVQDGVVNTVLQGNYIDARGLDTNSALFLTPDLGPSSAGPLTVTGNWLDGGNFTVYVLDGDNGRYYIKNIAVTNNYFGRSSVFGPDNVNVPVTWSGNVWDDTGKLLNL